MDELTIDRTAPRRIALDGGSWLDLAEGFVRDPDRALHDLHATTAWRQQEVLRYERYVPEQRLHASLAPSRHPLLHQSDLHLRSTYRVPAQGAAAILYRNGDDFQGLHSDRELRWLDDTLIAIVVLGARRPFVLRPRRPLATLADKVPAGADPSDVVLTPGEGDLLVMGGACQRDWLHGVPRAPGELRPRVSLTWRWTSRRGRPDTNPSYYDGRNYSDRPRRPGTRTRQPGTRTRPAGR
ncbi:MAG: alpha-ketoglutarate-dependent dioxygenase AlkB [Acidimicrobiales bacterium]